MQDDISHIRRCQQAATNSGKWVSWLCHVSTDLPDCDVTQIKHTDSLCRRYSQNVFVDNEATRFTNLVYIVEVSAVMTAVYAPV